MAEPTPLRAHHRLMRHLVSTSGADGVDPRPEDLDRVASVFHRAGGSWERVFGGSVSDLGLLKRVLRVAVKGGHLTSAPNWEK